MLEPLLSHVIRNLPFLDARVTQRSEELPFSPIETNQSELLKGSEKEGSLISELLLCWRCKIFWRFRGRELLEARIIPQRIERWIEPEQRRS